MAAASGWRAILGIGRASAPGRNWRGSRNNGSVESPWERHAAESGGCLPQHAPHLCVHRFWQAVHDVACFMYLTALSGHVASESRSDRLGEAFEPSMMKRRGRAGSRPRSRRDRSAPGRSLRFLRRLDQPKRMFVAVRINAYPALRHLRSLEANGPCPHLRFPLPRSERAANLPGHRAIFRCFSVRIDLDAAQGPVSFVRQTLDRLRNVSSFRKPIGFVINYSPNKAVRFDLNGQPIAILDKAVRPGTAVLLRLGGRPIPAEVLRLAFDK